MLEMARVGVEARAFLEAYERGEVSLAVTALFAQGRTVADVAESDVDGAVASFAHALALASDASVRVAAGRVCGVLGEATPDSVMAHMALFAGLWGGGSDLAGQAADVAARLVAGEARGVPLRPAGARLMCERAGVARGPAGVFVERALVSEAVVRLDRAKPGLWAALGGLERQPRARFHPAAKPGQVAALAGA